MKPEEKFFYQLLKKTKVAYYKSPISKKLKEGWGASVCATPIRKGKTIIVEGNWSAVEFPFFQEYYPYVKKYEPYPFLQYDPLNLRRYLPLNATNFCNVCFFRTPKENYLGDQDWKISIPLFEEYVNYIKPEFIIILGETPIIKLKKHSKIDSYEEFSLGTNLGLTLYRGELFGKYDFISLPHPNDIIKKEDLNELKEYIQGILVSIYGEPPIVDDYFFQNDYETMLRIRDKEIEELKSENMDLKKENKLREEKFRENFKKEFDKKIMIEFYFKSSRFDKKFIYDKQIDSFIDEFYKEFQSIDFPLKDREIRTINIKREMGKSYFGELFYDYITCQKSYVQRINRKLQGINEDEYQKKRSRFKFYIGLGLFIIVVIIWQLLIAITS